MFVQVVNEFQGLAFQCPANVYDGVCINKSIISSLISTLCLNTGEQELELLGMGSVRDFVVTQIHALMVLTGQHR